MTSARHRLLRLLALAVVAAWFLCPLPQPSAIKTVDVDRPGPPSSTVVEERIVCARTSDEILLRAFPQLSGGRVQIGEPRASPQNTNASSKESVGEFGLGECSQAVIQKAISRVLKVLKPYAFLVVTLALPLRPSTAPEENAFLATNQFKINCR